MARLLLAIALLVGLSGFAFGQAAPASEIAPNGKLRVGMIAITVLGGVAEPVARFIGQKLGAAVEPVMYPSPDAYLQSFGKGEWDIAIGPRVLAPVDKADSTADLWVIRLIYVAAPGKEFPDTASVDKAGVKIGTIRGAPSERAGLYERLALLLLSATYQYNRRAMSHYISDAGTSRRAYVAIRPSLLLRNSTAALVAGLSQSGQKHVQSSSATMRAARAAPFCSTASKRDGLRSASTIASAIISGLEVANSIRWPAR